MREPEHQPGSAQPSGAATTSLPAFPGPLGGVAARVPLEVPSRFLSADGIILRPLGVDDRGAYLGAVRISRPELDAAHPLHEPGETDDEMFDRQLLMQSEGERTGRACRRIAVLPDGRVVGAFNVNAIARGLSFEGELAWWVRTDLKGRGLATAGVRAIASHAMADLPDGLGLHTLHAMIEPANHASRRIAEKLGFTPVSGVVAKVRIGEEWRTHDMFALTLESFSAAQPSGPVSARS